MTAANKKFQQLKRKVHALNSWKSEQDKSGESIPDKDITNVEVQCPKCSFKARYKFLRCPECNEVQS